MCNKNNIRYSVDCQILKKVTCILVLICSFQLNAQYEWDRYALPKIEDESKKWQLQTAISDDFNYTFDPTKRDMDFGPMGQPPKWNNFFHNNWKGPGPTIWSRNHVAVRNGKLNIWATRRKGETKTFNGNITRPATRSGCITSKKKVKYPVFIEAKVRIMNSTLASDIWLLSPDDTQEIDILEVYGGVGDDQRNSFFAERIHLSHHVFIRPPKFKDYQPGDFNSWYRKNGVTKWGGKTIRIGVYWKNEKTLEYYIDGELVRVLSNNAFKSRNIKGEFEYTYPAKMIKNKLTKEVNGFQKVIKTPNFKIAKKKSKISVIDPYNYLKNGKKLTKAMHIIINVEDQSWQAIANRSPNDKEIKRHQDNNFLIDWIRVYKPVKIIK